MIAAVILGALFFMSPVQASPNITAPMAVVMCFDTGDILYERNMHDRWIPASMTKSLTAFIVYEEIEAGNLALDTRLRVSANAARFSQDRRAEGSFVPLREGAYITVEMLLRLTMLPSANAACVVFAEHISGSEAAFVERMNQTAYDLGMYTSFNNSHGAIAHHSDAYSSAVLVREFISRFPDILRITRMAYVDFDGTRYNNTNRLLPGRTMPVTGVDGFKTGSLRAAGWNHSVTAIRDGRRIIAVVMGTVNVDAAMRDSRTLIEFGFEELARVEAAHAARVRVFHNGQLVPMTTPVIVEGNRMLMPLYAIFRPLGFDLAWDGTARVATAEHTRHGRSTATAGNVRANVRGNIVHLPVAPRVVEGRVFVPVEFVEAVTSTTMAWCRTTGVVNFR